MQSLHTFGRKRCNPFNQSFMKFWWRMERDFAGLVLIKFISAQVYNSELHRIYPFSFGPTILQSLVEWI